MSTEETNITMMNQVRDACVSGTTALVATLTLLACNTRFMYAMSAIHWFAEDGTAEQMEMLLDKVVDVNELDVNGQTALHYAAYTGNVPTANELFRRGVDLSIVSRDGETASAIASRHGFDHFVAAIMTEEIRRRDHGFKRAVDTTVSASTLHTTSGDTVDVDDDDDNDDDDDEDDDDDNFDCYDKVQSHGVKGDAPMVVTTLPIR